MSVNPYARQADMLSDREKEALLFEKMRGRVLLARQADEFDLSRARTIADLRRLWAQVATLVGDPDNRLPLELRASIISIAMAMLRDIESGNPDLEAQAEVLGNFAAGLKPAASGEAPVAVAPGSLSLTGV